MAEKSSGVRAAELASEIRVFWRKVLSHSDDRAFFRSWIARSAATGAVTKPMWTEFQSAAFVSGGRNRTGKDIAGDVRRHLAQLQKGRCCYCARRLVGIAYARPIEHILPRRDFGQYTFVYRNLAVCCYDCNLAKRDANWSSVGPAQGKYPGVTAFPDCFHPRYHSYSEHIDFVHVETNSVSLSVFRGKTPQGKQLCKDLLWKTSRREVLVKANPNLAGSLHKLEIAVAEDGTAGDALSSFMDALEAVIQHPARPTSAPPAPA